MARPKPQIILDYTNPKTYKSEQILEADAIYAVFYAGNPISLVNYPGPKYKKVSFSNSGHAFNLAERLNTLFKTDKFEVIELKQGRVVKEKNDDQTPEED